MNILVTGSNGQLGTHLGLLAEGSERNHWMFCDIDTLDITNETDVARYVEKNGIDCIVNCAAYTNVDAAEDAESDADKVNNQAVGILAREMAKKDGMLVHISTDYVLGGNLYNTPCSETAEVNPTGAYGRTKLAGEKAVAAAGCRSIIIRTGWLYSEYGRNFVKTMLSLMATRDNLTVVYDQVGTPTYAGDLAQVIFDIVEKGLYQGHYGLYNYSNEGVCSWYDFANAIARISGSACRIAPCRSSDYPSKVVRPSYSVLDKSKIKQTFNIDIPYWESSLQKCVKNIQK